jgi:NAD(P)-dependent dehydrogenase (short-subunit alcohol dehydrogenase family)
MAERMRLKGRTAVITGAAGGIGRAIAVSLARRGCHLALADLDEAGMVGTEDLVRAYGVRVTRHSSTLPTARTSLASRRKSPPSTMASTCSSTMRALQ